MTDVDPYCWAGSRCLKNHLGITDPEELAAAEAQVSRARDTMLARDILPGSYDLDHLRRFHRVLFGDVYPWAGEVRTVGLAKLGHPFCMPQFIVGQLDAQFTKLEEDRYLLGLRR